MDEYLAIFGQQPGLNRIYTQLCFCLRVTNDSPEHRSAIEYTLKSGLKQISASFTWIAGQVIHDKAEGCYKIRSFEKTPRLIIRDIRARLPSMEDYQSSWFPGTMLTEDDIAPCMTFRQSQEDPAPVFLLQANFVIGGVLLVFNGLHSCMDMAGQAQLISLFSKACRDEGFSAEELSAGNVPRRNVIPLLADNERFPEGDTQFQKHDRLTTSSNSTTSPGAVWAYFSFSADALGTLKSLATKDVTSGFVSTDDVLSAFIWQSVSRARLPRLSEEASVVSVFTRTVDTRRHLDIPPPYLGNAATKTSCNMPINKLVAEPLGSIASRLRAFLSDVGYKIRTEATLLSRGSSHQRSQWSRPQVSTSAHGRRRGATILTLAMTWVKRSLYGGRYLRPGRA